MTKLISADQFRKELRANRTPTDGVYRVNTEGPVPVDGAERTLRFCFSDDSVDRMGDTIDAAGRLTVCPQLPAELVCAHQ